jgi:hypothetical protein
MAAEIRCTLQFERGELLEPATKISRKDQRSPPSLPRWQFARAERLVERRLAGGGGLCGLCNRIGQKIRRRSEALAANAQGLSLEFAHVVAGESVGKIGNAP